MSLTERKNECNLKYAKLLDVLRQKGDIQVVHNLIIDVAEALVGIGQVSSAEKAKCQKKAIYLVKVAKDIKASNKHEDIYFKLTGEKIDCFHSGELDNIKRELGNLQNKDKDLVLKKQIPSVIDLPNIKKQDEMDSIRPMYLEDYVGQLKVKTLLQEAIEAAKLKNRPLEHILFFGSAGLGKTSLSKIVANEMNSQIIIMSGPTIKDPMALVSIIKNVKHGDIVFIDEIHRINQLAAEAIYTVMEDFELSYVQKNKDGARNITLKLPQFTIIGATTHSGMLEKPMRDRFTLQFKLDLYNEEDLSKIALSTIEKLGNYSMTANAALEIAKRSRGIPRNCNSYVKRLYDRALVRQVNNIDTDFAKEYFAVNEIDEKGLMDIDIQYMKAIYEKFGNKPVGIDNLASCLGEGRNIIESQIEPYLLYLGLIQITPSGRMLTSSGMDYIGSNYNDIEKNDLNQDFDIKLGENFNPNYNSKDIQYASEEIKKVLSDQFNEQIEAMKEIISANLEEKFQDLLPLQSTAQKSYLDKIKVTAEFLVKNAKRDDDYIPAAAMLYSNIEENLICTFKLQHENKKFVIEYEEFLEIADTAKIGNNYLFKRYNDTARSFETFTPRVVDSLEDGSPKTVEMSPIMRFIKAGLTTVNAKRASDYWVVLNRIRHKSPENQSQLNSFFTENSISKREYLLSAISFFKDNNLYTKE